MLNNKKICFLVAYTKNRRVIGFQGKIPWNLTSERNRFKQLCAGKKIIMGRKSFDEIGHALPYCTIIIVSKNLKTAPKDCLLANSLEQAISMISDKEILVTGGEEIYKQLFPFVDKIYATEIHCDFDGDSFFPPLPFSPEIEWESQMEASCCENNITYDYITFTKKIKSHKR